MSIELHRLVVATFTQRWVRVVSVGRIFNDVKDELKNATSRTKKSVSPKRCMDSCPAIPDDKIYQLVHDTYYNHPKTWIFWYAFDRVDLNGNGEGSGFQIDHNRVAWDAIKKYHDAFNK